MNDNKRTVLIAVLAAILLIFIIVSIVLIVNLVRNSNDKNKEGTESQTAEQLLPDYPPQETDPNQKPMDNDPGGSFETAEGAEGVNLTYELNATVDLSDESVSLYYANPSKSTQDMVVKLVVDDKIICASKKLVPGNEINNLSLEAGMKDVLTVGGYDAKFVIGCYDPQSSEKAVVDLVVDKVRVTVVE